MECVASLLAEMRGELRQVASVMSRNAVCKFGGGGDGMRGSGMLRGGGESGRQSSLLDHLYSDVPWKYLNNGVPYSTDL